MIQFDRRVLFVGFGAVARCTLPILLKHVRIPPQKVTIMDFEPNAAALRPWLEQGVSFVKDRITPENLGTLLGQHVTAGDLLIDLAWNIDCCEIVQWCHDQGVLYINTSVELWDPYGTAEDQHPTARTLYWRHMNLRRLTAGWKEPGPTAVLEHGANPGLISHFTKQALLDIAEKALADKKFIGAQAEKITHHAKHLAFNHLARTIVSEIDRLFPKPIEILAEPGRFLVASAATAISKIIGKAVRGGKLCYYLDDGVYHTFSGVIFDHCHYHLKSFKKGPTQICSVFGPTCDALDTISIGAYSAASSTSFNGFPPAKVVHINQ